MVIGDMLLNNARRYANKPGIVDEDGTRLTWGEINQRVNSLCHAMLNLGLKKGDRVAVVSENNHQFAEILFATAKVGLVSVGLNYRLTSEQLSSLIRSCEPKALIVQDKFAAVINSISPQPSGVSLWVGIGDGHHYPNDYETLIKEYSPIEPAAEVNEDDILTINYTSGTTGLPKGAIVTHRNRFTLCVAQGLLVLQLVPSDVVLISTPLFGSAGQSWLSDVLFAGSTGVVHVFKAQGWAEIIERERVTVTQMIPTRYKMVLEHLQASARKCDLSSLKRISIGPQAMSRQELQEMMRFFGVSSAVKHYGSAEAALVTYLLSEEISRGLSPDATEADRKKVDSVGLPLLDTRMKLVDDNGKEVGVKQVGEILVKGEVVMKGYWNLPDLSAEVLKGGWYHTNDLGWLDEDGYLYFAGRKDNMIKTGGFLVGPGEIEEVIGRHPAVREVAVIGVPDAKWGQAIKAIVCLKEGQSLTQEEVKEHCRKYLAGYQVPKTVDFINELPRDMLGKVQLKELRRIFGGN